VFVCCGMMCCARVTVLEHRVFVCCGMMCCARVTVLEHRVFVCCGMMCCARGYSSGTPCVCMLWYDVLC